MPPIGPHTSLARLLPRPGRRAQWAQLADTTGLRLPKLRHPRWARDTIRILTAIAAIATYIEAVNLTHPHGLLWIPPLLAATFAALVAFKGLYACSPFLATDFPVRTVGELTEVLAAFNENVVRNSDGSITIERAIGEALEQARQGAADRLNPE